MRVLAVLLFVVALHAEWKPVPAHLPAGRVGFGAASLADGRVLVAGGSTGSRILETVEIYDPQTNAWSDSKPLPCAATSFGIARGPDGRVFIAGGTDAQGAVLPTVASFDPKDETWTLLPALPTPRSGLSLTADMRGRLYAIGGTDRAGRWLDTVEVFDPKTRQWRTGASLPHRRMSAAAVYARDRIYLAGGWQMDAAGRLVETAGVSIYDPVEDYWEQGPSLGEARASAGAAATPGGGILIAGGYRLEQKGNGAFSTTLDSAEWLAPGSDQWVPADSLPKALGAPSAVSRPSGDILLVGGVSLPPDRPVVQGAYNQAMWHLQP